MDLLRLTIAYLRIWKLCDLEFYTLSQRDSSRVFDVIPIDELRLKTDLVVFRDSLRSDPSWADHELGDSINTLFSLLNRKPLSDDDLNLLEVLRAKAQQKALKYSGEIKIAIGGGAAF